MTTTLTAGTLTTTVTEAITMNGVDHGSTNARTVSNVTEISKRIVTVTTTETIIAAFSTIVGQGTYIAANVRYLRITNKDGDNFVYLVFKNEYSNEFCVKLDSGQSYIYNGDNVSGVIDTMLANQVALGFTEATGDTGTGDSFIDNITANGAIIPGLRVSHDSGYIPASTSVGAVTGAANGVSAATSHTTVTRHATTGAESVSEGTGVDSNGTSTYAAGFGDLVEITADADSASCDLEIFIASI